MNIKLTGNRTFSNETSTKPSLRNQQKVFSTLLEQSTQKTVKDSINITRQSKIEHFSPPRNSAVNLPSASPVELEAQQSEVFSFSGSYQERLEQLQRLNSETEWSSMSDVEKAKTFEDRYRQAFEADNFFLVAGLYTTYSKQHQEIYSSYLEEHQKYFNSQQGVAKTESRFIDCYREAYYSNMTDLEVRAAIRERWQGSGSMEDTFAILAEYSSCGVSTEIDGIMMNQVRLEVHRKAESFVSPMLRGTQTPPSDSPYFGSYFISCAKGVGAGAGFGLSWTQLAQSVIDSYGNMVRPNDLNSISPDELERIRGMLDDFLNELLGKEYRV